MKFVLACLLAISAALTAAERPNIVLVMADDQGWGDMAYMGHPKLHTPNFDQAAAEGLRFDKFYAAAPVCSPTRASVLTGRTPNRLGVFKWGYPMRPQEKTIAELLKASGYTTAHFGKWHLGSVRKGSPANPGNNGFDHWVSAENFYDNDPILCRNGTAVQFTGESSVLAAELAVDWMKSAAKGEDPFFAVVWFGSPHDPHRAAPEDRKHYEDEPKAHAEFLGEVTGMDRAYGMLREALQSTGVKDNTLLWYCSDNGALPKVGSTGGHRGHKGKVYEGGLLVPAIIEWPARFPKPKRIDTRCVTSDILPTVAAAAGIDAPTDRPLDGINLLPVLDGTTADRSQALGFWDTNAPGISTPSDRLMSALLKAQKEGGELPVPDHSKNAAKLPEPPRPLDRFPGHAAWVEGDWKLHRIEKKGNPSWELYNLAQDPKEETDLAGTEGDRLQRMQKALDTWLQSVVRSLNGEDY